MKIFIQSSVVFLLLILSSAVFADVAVIVAKDSNFTVSKDEIPRLFLGKLKEFGDGTVATPVYAQDENPTHNEFNDKVLKKSAGKLKAYWSKLLFSGKGSPPEAFATDVEIIAEVIASKGTIGYISTESVSDSVKVLATF